MIQNAKNDFVDQANEAVKDILLYGLPLLLIGMVISYYVAGIAGGLSFFAGSIVSIVNFLLLKMQLQAIVSSTVNNTKMPIWAAFGYIGRFFIMGAVLFLLGRSFGAVGILCAGIGLFLVRGAIFIYSLSKDFNV